MVNSVFELRNLNGINGFTINGVAEGDWSGAALHAAGDMNGDGIDDFITGAYKADPGGRIDAGESYLIFGHQDPWPRQMTVSVLDGTNGVIFEGIAANDNSGLSVSSAGDINGDGVNDLIIGAPSASRNGSSVAGESYLIFGHQGIWPERIPLSTLNGTQGVMIEGIANFDWSGWDVSSAGDVNGDGIDDLLIGAYRADPSDRSDAGESYLIFGHQGRWPSNISLSALNGTNGVIIEGIVSGDQSGLSVSSAGDVNADGVDDLIIGARWASPGGRFRAGESYLIFGHDEAWPARLSLATMDGRNGVIIEGILENDRSGYSVSVAGDINGDGVSDVLIGAFRADPGDRIEAGESYLVFGHPGTWPSHMLLSTLNGSNGVIIEGISAYDQSGLRVSNAGDVNDDGLEDAIIGARSASPDGRIEAGESYLLFGRRGAWPSRMLLSTLNGSNGVIINGISPGDHSGYAVCKVGDINGDGFSDVCIGSYKADADRRNETGQSHVIFGGSEQFIANALTIQRGESLQLTLQNIAMNPLIESRDFTIMNATHGRFAFAEDLHNTITNFTQKQIDDGEVFFIHDGSSEPPSYTITANRITRVFSDVHPQEANITFIDEPQSLDSTSEHPDTIQPISSNQSTQTTSVTGNGFSSTMISTLVAAITSTATVLPTLHSTHNGLTTTSSFFTEPPQSDNDSDSNDAWVGIAVAIGVALLAVGFFCGRYRNRGSVAFSADNNGFGPGLIEVNPVREEPEGDIGGPPVNIGGLPQPLAGQDDSEDDYEEVVRGPRQDSIQDRNPYEQPSPAGEAALPHPQDPPGYVELLGSDENNGAEDASNDQPGVDRTYERGLIYHQVPTPPTNDENRDGGVVPNGSYSPL